MKSIYQLIVFILVLALQACGNQVPGGFRGQYVDASTGATLELNAQSGTFVTPQGRSIAGSRLELGFTELQKGKPGLYMRPNPINKDIIEVFWLEPRMETLQEAGQMQWFESTVIYLRLPAKTTEKQEQINLVYTEIGTVMLDVPTRQWQVGWPADALILDMRKRK